MQMMQHFFATISFFQTHLVVADIGTAFLALASLMEKYVIGVMTVALIIEGYMYATSLDDPQKLMHVKKAIAATIVGGMIVVLAASLAPELVAAFGK